LKFTKFDFFWSSDRDHAGGAYSAPPDLVDGFKGLLVRAGREGRRRDTGNVESCHVGNGHVGGHRITTLSRP